MLLNTLRRLAQQNPNLLSQVEHGLDVGYYDREDTHLAEAEARIIEGDADRLQALPVLPLPSRFSSFLDGIQRAEVKAYHGPIPIVYGYGAAVVRNRVDRQMQKHPRDLLLEREAVFFPFRLLDPRDLFGDSLDGIPVEDTSPPAHEPLPLFPPTLYARAAESVSRWRERIERSVAERWCKESSSDEWLLADGTLTISPELAGCPRAVGVIKNHRTRFFDGDDARTLLGLRAGERTSVFAPQSRSWTPVHSWYLRLRDPSGHDVFWGLVRVEIAQSNESSRIADEVSGWLLAENAPLSLPDARWDRLLYPIHDCEQFLKARAPSLR